VLVAGLLSFIVALFRGPADGFVFDARHYWDGAQAVLSGGDFYAEAGLAIRGVLSTFVYVPAALVSAVLGSATAGTAVLIQNALLVAILAVWVVPGLLSLVVPRSGRHVWASALLTTALLWGFVPYPLLDLWALGFLFLGVLLVFKTGWIPLVLGGLALGVALNLRPAYLVPLAFGAIAWAWFNWSRAWLPAVGMGVALFPQLLATKLFAGSWRPWPIDTFLITDIQAQYAGFIVRYDTIAFGGTRDPRQFFCSPDLAGALVGEVPRSSLDLLVAFARHLPQSLVFLFEKVAASLQWSWATPYARADDSLSLSFMSITVTVVAVVGFGALLGILFRRRTAKLDAAVMVLLAIWLGSVATLTFSTPETRFALPIVFIGVLGVLSLIRRVPERPLNRASWVWVTGAVALAAVLLWSGSLGLDHPAPPGNVTARVCSQS
jgi:hypothetical protein